MNTESAVMRWMNLEPVIQSELSDTNETEQIAPSKKKFQHTETFCNIGCKNNHHCVGVRSSFSMRVYFKYNGTLHLF